MNKVNYFLKILFKNLKGINKRIKSEINYHTSYIPEKDMKYYEKITGIVPVKEKSNFSKKLSHLFNVICFFIKNLIKLPKRSIIDLKDKIKKEEFEKREIQINEIEKKYLEYAIYGICNDYRFDLKMTFDEFNKQINEVVKNNCRVAFPISDHIYEKIYDKNGNLLNVILNKKTKKVFNVDSPEYINDLCNELKGLSFTKKTIPVHDDTVTSVDQVINNLSLEEKEFIQKILNKKE